MCFECFKSKPAKEWRAIGFNKHLLSIILRISLMRIMKSSETLGDIPEKSMIHWRNFPKYSLSLLHVPIRRGLPWEFWCFLHPNLGIFGSLRPWEFWAPTLLSGPLPLLPLQCPVYDLDNNVAFIGMYQTMTKKAAITVQVGNARGPMGDAARWLAFLNRAALPLPHS